MNPTFNPHVSRRYFIRTGAVGTAALDLGLPALSASRKAIPIGLQLWSIHEECEKDLPKALKTVAKIGYKGVEFAGYYGLQAKELRQMLDDHGLVCCGTHTPLETIQPENLAATIEFNQVLGNKYLIVSWMDLKTKEAWLAKARLFSDQVPKVKAAKMVLGYHGYQGQLYDGVSGWDLFFGNTPPDVAMQVDTSSCVYYKVDPVEVVKKYPGRSRTIHLKECGGPQFAAIGEGEVNFKALLDACEQVGGTEWYIVEDERGGDALDTVRRCYTGMKKLGRA